jgi:hypothetical protein
MYSLGGRITVRYMYSLGGEKCGLLKGVVSLERNNLVLFYYLTTSEIWPDKAYGLW